MGIPEFLLSLPEVSFNNLPLIEPLQAALRKIGYITPTSIQEQAIPHILEGKDLLGCAQTGTGKTGAFTLPLLQLMFQRFEREAPRRVIRTLILTPTRELATQIGESIRDYGCYLPLKHAVIFGGVPQSAQVKVIREGVEILVATPGRLLDLMQQNIVQLNHVRYFVLDEADRMLDMGFVRDVNRIITKLPAKKQTLFFSATMPPEIRQLAGALLHDPVKVEVSPVSSTVDLVEQKVYYVAKTDKFALLLHLLKDPGIERMLLFIQMKHHADKLVRQLIKAGIYCEAIHGDKLQRARERALDNFKAGKTRVLVATDIAARGIDIEELTHVLNYDLPNVPETYVHRIGRTGRAGATGVAISFCDWTEKSFLTDIQKLIKKNLTVVKAHPYDNPMMHTDSVNLATASSFSNMRRGGKKSARRVTRF
jgi:ATP-dependent RNA helicase RhlE